MTDVYGAEKRSAVMRRVKAKGTGPELAARRLVWSLGGRYRLNRADLPGKPDIVLAGRRLAIFVHGCFWHGHDCARGARVPKANQPYWIAKITRNRARDTTARKALEAAGWRVETIWECRLKDAAALEAEVTDWLRTSSPHPHARDPGAERLRAVKEETKAAKPRLRAPRSREIPGTPRRR